MTPLPLKQDEATSRAVANLDRIPPVDFHKVAVRTPPDLSTARPRGHALIGPPGPGVTIEHSERGRDGQIGVVFVDEGQRTDRAIFSNSHGSPRYSRFVHQLGQLVRLKGVQAGPVRTRPRRVHAPSPDMAPWWRRASVDLGVRLRPDCKDIFTGGLDTTNDVDGEYAYYWQDDVTQIIFHVATMMPAASAAAGDGDMSWVNKKRHIGNDYVTIVFNDSTRDFSYGARPADPSACGQRASPLHQPPLIRGVPARPSLTGGARPFRPSGTLASQFDYVNLVVRPLDDDTYQVSMLRKDTLPDFSALTDPKVLSERSVATFVRQTALLANHMSILHVRSRET